MNRLMGEWRVGELNPDKTGPAQTDERILCWLKGYGFAPEETYRVRLFKHWGVVFRYRRRDGNFYTYAGTTVIAKRLPRIVRRKI